MFEEKEHYSFMTKHDNSIDRSIWICRHGNRIDFVDPAWKGHDPHLSSDGVLQAQETGRRLRRERIRHIFASPFLRTVETAFHIAEALDLEIKIEHGACEWLNPQWFSDSPRHIPPEDLVKRFPRIDLNYSTFVSPQYPETWVDCMKRCRRTAKNISTAYYDNILIVGHGASVSGITQALLDDTCDISAGLCALFTINYSNERSSLVLNGDTSHLTGGEQCRKRFK